jgi:hypothetical protein
MQTTVRVNQNQSYNEDLVDGLHIFLQQLARDSFFGTVTFQFSEGQVILVRQETTMKPSVFLK